MIYSEFPLVEIFLVRTEYGRTDGCTPRDPRGPIKKYQKLLGLLDTHPSSCIKTKNSCFTIYNLKFVYNRKKSADISGVANYFWFQLYAEQFARKTTLSDPPDQSAAMYFTHKYSCRHYASLHDILTQST